MKGDRVEVVVDVGGGETRTYEVVAARAGRRVETTTGRGVVEVAEVTRTGQVVRTAQFMQSRVVAVVEHPADDGIAEGDERDPAGAPPEAAARGPGGPVPVTIAPSPGDVETVERVIAAPPEKIFALLADPRRHHDIDGSGTVHEAKDAPSGSRSGSTFGMSMKVGIPYSMVSTVVEFEENRRIAWQTRPPRAKIGQLVGGRIWRYELEPVDGGTRVRESWDISRSRSKALIRPGAGKTRKSMEQTLARIERARHRLRLTDARGSRSTLRGQNLRHAQAREH